MGSLFHSVGDPCNRFLAVSEEQESRGGGRGDPDTTPIKVAAFAGPFVILGTTVALSLLAYFVHSAGLDVSIGTTGHVLHDTVHNTLEEIREQLEGHGHALQEIKHSHMVRGAACHDLCHAAAAQGTTVGPGVRVLASDRRRALGAETVHAAAATQGSQGRLGIRSGDRLSIRLAPCASSSTFADHHPERAASSTKNGHQELDAGRDPDEHQNGELSTNEDHTPSPSDGHRGVGATGSHRHGDKVLKRRKKTLPRHQRPPSTQAAKLEKLEQALAAAKAATPVKEATNAMSCWPEIDE